MYGEVDRFATDEMPAPGSFDEAARAALYKRVNILASIIGRKLRLVEGDSAHTDGYTVTAPIDDPAAYKLVGHELAHILFETSTTAHELFVTEYVERVVSLVARHSAPLKPEQVSAMQRLVRDVLNALECRRVETLWGILYEGDYTQGRAMAHHKAETLQGAAHQEFATYLQVIEGGVDPGEGRFRVFQKYCVEAFMKVSRRGPGSTYIVAKWLITHLVSEILAISREAKETNLSSALPDHDKGPAKQDEHDEGDDEDYGDDESGGNVGANAPSDDESIGEGDVPSADVQGRDTGGSFGSGRHTKRGPKDAKAEVESGTGTATASQKERAEALKKLLSRTAPKSIKGGKRDVRPPPSLSRPEAEAAAKMVADALGTNVGDSASLEEAMRASGEGIERAREAQKVSASFDLESSADGRLRENVQSKIVFHDIGPSAAEGLPVKPLSAEDLEGIKRLRGMFGKILGRKRAQLDEAGYEVDIQAAIERRVSRTPIPIYKHDMRGQGFRALVLIDRSSSTFGYKQLQLERAVRILARSTRYPFVKFHVWGFQSLASGQVDLMRFDPKLDVFTTPKSPVAGETPLHFAIRAARTFLEAGDEQKHLYVITDGLPSYRKRDGKEITTQDLLLNARDEVYAARTRNISVVGGIVGTRETARIAGSTGPKPVYYELGPKELNFVFGGSKNWKQIDPDLLGQSTVNMVADKFTEYLQNL